MNFIKRKLTVFFIIIFITGNISAQHNYGFSQFAEDSENIILKPFRWDKADLLTFGGLLVMTTASVLIDKDIKIWVNENNSYQNSFPLEVGRFYGNVYFGAAICGSFYLGGLAFDNNKFKKIGFELFETLLFAGITTTALKYSLGRERPTITNDPYNFNPFSFKGFDFRSFSSGHAAVAFSISTVLAANVENDYLKALIFVPAVLTSVSRVYQNYHWTSDVIAGSAIGYFIGSYVSSLHSPPKNISVLFTPGKIFISVKF